MFYTFLVISLLFASSFLENAPNKLSSQKSLLLSFMEETAYPGQFPWQVALVKDKKFYFEYCTGSLISHKLVLTAAHCVDGEESIKVMLGWTSVTTPSPESITVISNHFIIHHKFNRNTLENNIALIVLPDDVEFSKYIKNIDLGTTPLIDGVNVTVASWGMMNAFSKNGLTSSLTYIDMLTLDNEKCREHIPELPDSKVCLTSLDNEQPYGACKSNEGGPLVTFSGKRALLNGVASSRKEIDCEKNHLLVFTRVSSYQDWIKMYLDLYS